MNDTTGLFAITVRTWSGLQDNQSTLNIYDIPSRSRFYGLLPCKVGTIWTESLTSYLNRLGWVHRVSPLGLVAQELVPHLSSEHLPARLTAFCRYAAMGLNGNGNLAHEWSTLLEQLTGQSDLSLLTLQRWIGNLLSRGHLQKTPAWCSACYTEWREKCLPIYQPLLWQYQAITLCPEHQQRLEKRCPQCSRLQSAISANRFEPGACTQCGAWLGSERDTKAEQGSDDEIAWQQWVIRALEELHAASGFTEQLQWEPFFTGLATCLQEQGAYSRLEHLTGIRRSVFYRWLGRPREPHSSTFSHHYIPSLEAILEFCHACDVTPFQIMTHQLGPLREIIHGGTMSRSVRPRRPAPTPINRQKCLELIQTILDEKEEPLSIRQIAKRLGCGERALVHHFPQECASITKRDREYRKQRQEQRLDLVCDLVRQTVITLHTQGIYPSHRKVRAILPTGLMRMPEANAIWHEVLHELGLDIH
jgi:hypothetical protein